MALIRDNMVFHWYLANQIGSALPLAEAWFGSSGKRGRQALRRIEDAKCKFAKRR